MRSILVLFLALAFVCVYARAETAATDAVVVAPETTTTTTTETPATPAAPVLSADELALFAKFEAKKEFDKLAAKHQKKLAQLTPEEAAVQPQLVPAVELNEQETELFNKFIAHKTAQKAARKAEKEAAKAAAKAAETAAKEAAKAEKEAAKAKAKAEKDAASAAAAEAEKPAKDKKKK